MTSKCTWSLAVFITLTWLRVCIGGRPAAIDQSQTPKTIQAIIGARATLHCYYSGFPSPQVIWIKNKKILKDCKRCVTKIDNALPQTAKLHVTPYREEDFGEYVCKVRNQNGFASVTITLVEKPSVHPDKSQCLKDIILGQDPRLNLEYRPNCDDDGLYHKVQCSIHLKKCWCVDRQSGHKTADAYKGQDGHHCTSPTDLSHGSIVTLCIGVTLLLVVTDIAAFAFCNKGITHYFVRCRSKQTVYEKLQRSQPDEELGEDPQDYDSTGNDKDSD